MLSITSAVFSQETADGVTTYYATIAMQGEVPVVCEGEEISAGAANQIRKLLGDKLVGMAKVNVTGALYVMRTLLKNEFFFVMNKIIQNYHLFSSSWIVVFRSGMRC